MKKLYIILGVLALFVFIASPASAWWNNNHYQYGGNATATGGNATGGNATVGNVSAAGGSVGNVKAKAVIKKGAIVNNNTNVIEEGAIKNKNVNKNKNTNVNVNVNKNKQQQGQIQGQMQGQLQGQKQDQDQDQGQEQGQMNNWTQTFEDKRDHITGPNVLQSDAKLSQGKSFTTKARGAMKFLSNVKELTAKQAKKLASKSSDITCEPALIMENKFSTNKVKCSYSKERSPGEYMGNLYMGSDGGDVNATSMIGEAAKRAMKAGATHMRLIEFGAGEMAQGNSWNIGFGGGASVITGSSGKTAVAPNGGLGFGSADSFNELRPEMVFELTFDASYASKYLLSKAGDGYSANKIEVISAAEMASR